MKYDLENVDIKKNFFLVETNILHDTAWNTYHNVGEKAPDWCHDLVKAIHDLNVKGWTTHPKDLRPKE